MRCLLSFLLLISISFSASPQDVWEEIIGDGFGVLNQKTLPEMEVFDGNLYAATSPIGPGYAKMWKSATGDIGSFTDITTFNPPLNAGVSSIHSFGVSALDSGHLWCGTGNNTKGGMVYKLVNGTDWLGVTPYGFGDDGLSGISPHMVVFQGSSDVEPYLCRYWIAWPRRCASTSLSSSLWEHGFNRLDSLG